MRKKEKQKLRANNTIKSGNRSMTKNKLKKV